MKFFIGTDIEHVSRFSKLIQNKPRILSKMFHPAEYEYALKSKNPDQTFTGTWCAKEAVLKCITEFADLTPRCIEIYRNEKGAPKCRILKDLGSDHTFEIQLSISHTDEYAQSTALLVVK